ncbi:hypothetical protein [Lysinibacillus capsici]|uniref:hypothetical protein n=1 Tax=Lysinibacillus capsici TaxID=2115968 RepID=UPI00325F9755
MGNVKNAKAVNLNHKRTKFGEGVILEPIRTANEQGGGGVKPTINCCSCCCSGCGSSNKIKVY